MPVSPQDLLTSANALRSRHQAKASRRALEALVSRYPDSDEAREAARYLRVHRVKAALVFGVAGIFLAFYNVAFSFLLTAGGHGVYAPLFASLGAFLGAPISLASWPVRRDKAGFVLATLGLLVAICVDVSLVVLTSRLDEGGHYISSGYQVPTILELAFFVIVLLVGFAPWFSWQVVAATTVSRRLRRACRRRSQAPATIPAA